MSFVFRGVENETMKEFFWRAASSCASHPPPTEQTRLCSDEGSAQHASVLFHLHSARPDDCSPCLNVARREHSPMGQDTRRMIPLDCTYLASMFAAMNSSMYEVNKPESMGVGGNRREAEAGRRETSSSRH